MARMLRTDAEKADMRSPTDSSVTNSTELSTKYVKTKFKMRPKPARRSATASEPIRMNIGARSVGV